MATTKFLKAEAGQQAAFGTAVAPTFKLPATGEYEDAQERVEATWDQGSWTPVEIVETVAEYATFTLDGTGFFELLPVLINAGLNEQVALGTASPYAYDDSLNRATTGYPTPYTFLFGGGESMGTGPAVRIKDAFLQTLTLSGNINSKEVEVSSSWFGREVDDNSDAGFAFEDAALPSNLGMLKTLLGTIKLKDAGAVGRNFTSMTSLATSMLDWTMTINTGLMPLWTSDGNQLTYAGIRYEEPSVTFAPTIRTNNANFDLIRVKYDDRTYQELELTLTGESSRQAILRLTGRWTEVPTPYARAENEVVMNPIFEARAPHTQTSSFHWFGWQIDTAWSHGRADYLAQEDGSALLQEDGSPIILY